MAKTLSFRVDPFFWLLAGILGWLSSESFVGTLLWIVVIFISVTVHECGHAFTAIAFGQRAKITLTAFGGLTEREGGKLGNLKEFLIVLNGPLAGFLLFFVCLSVLSFSGVKSIPIVGPLFSIGYYVNLFWTVVNLAPVQPLDGGQLLVIACRSFFGQKGVRVAFLLSLILSCVFALLFFSIQAFIAGSFFLLFAFESFRNFRFSRFLTVSDDNENLKEELQEAVKLYEAHQFSAAEKRLVDLRGQTKGGVLFLTATLYLARIYENQGKIDMAYDLLEADKEKFDEKQLVTLQRLAYSTRRYDEAIRLGSEIHRELGLPEVAFYSALSHAQMSQPKEAIGWFETALRDGLESPEVALRHPGLDPIRSSEEMRYLVSRIDT